MQNNITDDDISCLINFLSQKPIPILTNGSKVREFEEEWSRWLGVKYSVFVNSGSSANILTFQSLKHSCGEVILSPLNWVSDVCSVLYSDMTPVFCDINLKTLALDENELEKRVSVDTKAVLLTHILGYNGLTDGILNLCEKKSLSLIEDVCESHGATFEGKKLGTFGKISNFSFYYAHHMTTIEGGMVCTNDSYLYNIVRSLRSHGMLREMDSDEAKNRIIQQNPYLNKDFIFLYPSYNMRSTEINAVLGLNQLKRLDSNNEKRRKNLDIFLDNLDSGKYYTGFEREGNSNYAFTLLLNDKDMRLRNEVEHLLKNSNVEFRRGMSGGGNQLRQPYLRTLYPNLYSKYPNCEHVHHFGWYIGNYPEICEKEILKLCNLLNNLK